jgi:hypothetical protein
MIESGLSEDHAGWMHGLADGTKARLPFRWPYREARKTDMFLMPSRPVDTRTAPPVNANRIAKVPARERMVAQRLRS